jgi:hypothetical protein
VSGILRQCIGSSTWVKPYSGGWNRCRDSCVVRKYFVPHCGRSIGRESSPVVSMVMAMSHRSRSLRWFKPKIWRSSFGADTSMGSSARVSMKPLSAYSKSAQLWLSPGTPGAPLRNDKRLLGRGGLARPAQIESGWWRARPWRRRWVESIYVQCRDALYVGTRSHF